MSTAAADAGAAPKKGLPKKLLIIIIAAVLVIAGGGGAAVFMMKKKAADAAAEEDGGAEHAAPAKKKHDDHAAAPTFVPLDPFTVNLADRDAERFAQIGVTLQVADPKLAEQMKTYMPAIRDGVLMILSHKTSAELLERAGKEKLAHEIGVTAARAMGYEIDDEDEDADAPKKASADDEEEAKPKKKKKKKKTGDDNPIQHVLFANFIIQ